MLGKVYYFKRSCFFSKGWRFIPRLNLGRFGGVFLNCCLQKCFLHLYTFFSFEITKHDFNEMMF